ncbi:MAG: hypothetical protein BWX70_03439 [Verrucomicrobia bacterium ADurb.Bin070]|nr:MAG: hypothetical protein BWX70_03439 [Verrucomicrobia bacterium ADurb.Bin070]
MCPLANLFVVVDADHGDVVRDGQPREIAGAHDCPGDPVVCGEDADRPRKLFQPSFQSGDQPVRPLILRIGREDRNVLAVQRHDPRELRFAAFGPGDRLVPADKRILAKIERQQFSRRDRGGFLRFVEDAGLARNAVLRRIMEKHGGDVNQKGGRNSARTGALVHNDAGWLPEAEQLSQVIGPFHFFDGLKVPTLRAGVLGYAGELSAIGKLFGMFDVEHGLHLRRLFTRYGDCSQTIK